MTGTVSIRGSTGGRLGRIALGYLFANLLATLAVAGAWALGATEDGLGALLAGMLGLWVGMVGTAVVVSRTSGTGDVRTDVGLRCTARDALIGVPVGVVAQLVVLPAVYFPLQVFDLDVDGAARDTIDRASGWTIPLLAIALTLGAPLVEELFFRGLLQGTLVERFGDRYGVALSAIVFASIHLQLVQFPGLLLAGLVFGVLAARYRRLGPAIWAHAGFNAATVVVLLV